MYKKFRCYISPLSLEAPTARNFTKFDLVAYLPDVSLIIYLQFQINQWRGLILWEVEFHHRKAWSPLTRTVQPVIAMLERNLSPVSTTRVHGPSTRPELTGRVLGCIFWHPSTRAVNSGGKKSSPELTARARHPSYPIIACDHACDDRDVINDVIFTSCLT